MIPSATKKERKNCGILQLLKKEMIGIVCVRDQFLICLIWLKQTTIFQLKLINNLILEQSLEALHGMGSIRVNFINFL